MINAVIGSLVTGLVLLGGFFLMNDAPVDVPLSGNSGTDHTEVEMFLAPTTEGGNIFATSSRGAVTYTAASLQNTKLIQHTAEAALTATLPASTTLGAMLPRVGDTRTIYVSAITTGITFAGGTGINLMTASSTVTKFLNASRTARLDFIRKSNGDVDVLLMPTI